MVGMRNEYKIFDRAYQSIEVMERILKKCRSPVYWWDFINTVMNICKEIQGEMIMSVFRIGEIPHSGSAVGVIQTIRGALLPIS
jgi:hypothetical protein